MISLFRPVVSEEAIAAVSEVLRSGWIGLGPKTREFELHFAEYVGARHAIAVNSATSALHLAMIAAGVGPGDEVLTTPFTFVSTNHAILYQQAHPVFADIDERTLNLDLRRAEELVTPRTRAIVAVHYGGNPVDLDRLYNFAARRGLAVIEDAAHACGATYRGRRIGSFGLTCFSFHAVKNLPTGDGGMVTTNDDAVYERLERLRWMGIDQSTFARSGGGYRWEYEVGEVGFKYHMNDITAAIGLEHLKQLDAWNGRRREIVGFYRALLADLVPHSLRFVETTPGAVSANHLCAIRVQERDAVVEDLRTRGIGVGVHYRPNHLYPPFASCRRGDLSVTERVYREVISLPLHLQLLDGHVRAVADALRAAILEKVRRPALAASY
jgi:perosamine synthetase